MLFCPYCGKEILEDSRFCESCGKNVEEAKKYLENAEKAQELQENVKDVVNKSSEALKDKNNQKMIGIAAAALALVIVIVLLFVNRKTTLDLNDYVKVTFDGYETLGTASVSFDWDQFEEDFAENAKGIKKTKKNNDDDSWYLSNTKMIVAIEDAVSFELNQNSELSNGDKIKLIWDYDDESLQDKYKVKLKGKDTEYVVEGLEQPKEVDPFADVTIRYEGIAPYAYAYVENNSKDKVVQYLYFQIEDGENIKNGETIKVTANIDEEYYLRNEGYIFTQTSKEFVCEGVDEYITEMSAITPECLEAMKNQSKDTIMAYLATIARESTYTNLNYEGLYFATVKNADGWNDDNIATIIYSATMQSVSDAYEPQTIYFPVEYRNLTKHADNTVTCDLNNTNISGYFSDFKTTGWSYFSIKGYGDKNTMYNDLVTAKVANYKVEVSE